MLVQVDIVPGRGNPKRIVDVHELASLLTLATEVSGRHAVSNVVINDALSIDSCVVVGKIFGKRELQDA